MQDLKIIFLFAIFTAIASAQPTLTEKITPAISDDTRPNSDSVPSIYALNGQFERVMVLRLKHQTDVLAGLESIVKKEQIANAVILSGIGSVTDYHVHSVANRTFPTKNMFLRDTTSSADIVNMNGYIIDGRVHAHIMLTQTDKAFGGHLEPGTTVFTFAVITIGVFQNGIDLRLVDKSNYR
jgi:predicted DNA-binding protein with PD1-like motif